MTDTRTVASDGDIYSNARFNSFREFLEKCGFTLRCLFETRIDKERKFPDLICYQIVGDDEHKPEVGTIIVRDYGDGYGIWFDRRDNSYQKDAWHIAGHNVPKPRCIVAIGAYCWGVGETVLEALENAKQAGHPAGEIGKPCYECFDAPQGAEVNGMGGITWPGGQADPQSIGFFDVKFRPVNKPEKKD